MKPQISIPEPCPENWANMTPEGKGRFCKSCEKVVIDFASMTDLEIKQYFLSKPFENTCGNFYKHQIELEKNSVERVLLSLYQATENNVRQKAAKWVCLLIIGFTLTLMGCRQKRYAGAIAFDHGSIRNLDENNSKNIIQNDSLRKN
jgi:hypothetical protein